MRSLLTNWFLPSSFEMRTSSTGYFAGGREVVSLSDCLLAGTNRICPAGISMRVSRLWWLLIAVEYHGVSSQTGSTMITKKGVVVFVEDARTCRIAFLMFPGSYSGFAVHEPVSL